MVSRALYLSENAMAHTCYRITRTSKPTAEDFLSYLALGRRPRQRDAASMRQAAGVSVFETEDQARTNARKYPHLGAYIVRLEIPDDAEITIDPVHNKQTGHHNIYGEPAEMLRYVVPPILPVEPTQ